MTKATTKPKSVEIPDLLPTYEDMQEFIKGKKAPEIDKILFKADEVIYDAQEQQDVSAAKIKKAVLKALELCPVCANAINILACFADSDEAAVLCYERSMYAARLVIGEKDFKEMKGQFWGFHETRLYMRALQGLAETLWEMSSHDKAIEHLNNMLELNPNDNQGVRYILAAWLVEAGRFEELGKLLKAFKGDGQATWPYTNALFYFHKEGNTAKNRKLLKEAYQTNKYIPAYILGMKKIPKELPEYMSFGGDQEAIVYAYYCKKGWNSVPKAKAWFKKTLGAT